MTIFCLIATLTDAAVFYTPTEYNDLNNEKVAIELELKTSKRQFKNEKANLEERNRILNNEIDNLNKKIANLKKQSKEDDARAKARIKELEKQRDILKKKGSNREKNLIEQQKKTQARYQREIESLKKKLIKERADNLVEIKNLNKKYEVIISSLNNKIANLNEELSNVKHLNKKQKRELDRMEKQANELAKKLEKEIELGQIRLKRFHDKLIINLDDNISFNSGSSALKKEIFPALKKITKILADYPENSVVIEGHTDNVPLKGSKRFRNNWQLSTERALSVLAYILRNRKLDPVRFSAAGYGEYQPIVPNNTKINRALNRRVDIVIKPRVKKFYFYYYNYLRTPLKQSL
jgi:chemotaxis protein MotB